jgi:hypothetical protein
LLSCQLAVVALQKYRRKICGATFLSRKHLPQKLRQAAEMLGIPVS